MYAEKKKTNKNKNRKKKKKTKKQKTTPVQLRFVLFLLPIVLSVLL
jgi:hypothetical protein